jgi:hypothetical protein
MAGQLRLAFQTPTASRHGFHIAFATPLRRQADTLSSAASVTIFHY